MKIGFVSPYLDSLSGGERYILTLASHWSSAHEVDLFWDDPSIRTRSSDRFRLDLSKVNIVDNVFATRNVFKKIVISSKYDLIFFLTDGSIPTTFAAHNILHFQVPFQNIPVHPVKLGRYNAIVCNSQFTKRNITRVLGHRAVVIYPPVQAIGQGKSGKKNIILSVGRFHPLKKQDVLIDIFARGAFNGYTLVLAGGLMPADELYVRKLQARAKGLAVKIIPNIAFEQLKKTYREAQIYWHAAGFHETEPERMEHFGISTVEAMSAGAVPVVYNGGGLSEIIRDGENGFLWASRDDLVDETARLIGSASMFRTMSRNAASDSVKYSASVFNGSFDALLESIMK